ncbi:hypothetical protein TcasGA2_TC033533 [Tribolium castaneum]|uniref:Uncharacterized protein n=1 Tax=Tribolium castaneum TaxID=7070 RepID=A0A139WFV2_TRICA|nr:hypothetical protein TcasGA2_TC033533 [Tribolium castaneum]
MLGISVQAAILSKAFVYNVSSSPLFLSEAIEKGAV